MTECVFCNIVKGVFQSSKVYEDESILAIMDIKPVNKGHVLIIPKVHNKLISDVDDDTVRKIFALANKINSAVRLSGIKCEGINYFLADGEEAGQEVFHTHLHLIPRFKNDGFSLKFPESYNDKIEKEELDIIAGKIKARLNS